MTKLDHTPETTEQQPADARPKRLTDILAVLPRLGQKPIGTDYLVQCAKIFHCLGLDPIATHGVTPEGWCTCGARNKETGAEDYKLPSKHAIGKHPIGKGWQEAPYSIKETEKNLRWYRKGIPNLSLRMGVQHSGIRVIAIDADGDLAGFEAEFGELPKNTLTMRSGSGGRHYIYTIPATVKPLNKVKIHSKTKTVPDERKPGRTKPLRYDVDIRADGAHIVCAPSRHFSGNQYGIELGVWPLELPAHFIPVLEAAVVIPSKPGASPTNGKRPRGRPSNIVRRAEAYCRDFVSVENEDGHGTLYSVALALFRGFSPDLPREEADRIFREFNARSSPPESEEQVEHKIADAIGGKSTDKPVGWLLAERPERSKRLRTDRFARAPGDAGESRTQAVSRALQRIQPTKAQRAALQALLDANVPASEVRESLGPMAPEVPSEPFSARQQPLVSQLRLVTGDLEAALGTVGRGLNEAQTETILMWLEANDYVSFDRFTRSIVWMRDDVRAGDRLKDADYVLWQREIQQQMGMAPALGVLRTALRSFANRYWHDQAQDWLASLAPWGGQTDHVLELHRRMRGPDSSIIQRMLWYWIAALVGRVAYDGTGDVPKADTVLVLIGEQEWRKSTVLNVLGLGKWTVKVSLVEITNHNRDKIARKVQGQLVVNIDELAGARKADLETVKAFITETSDAFDVKYQVEVENSPRRFVWAGTADNRRILRDPAGDRRFIPFELSGLITVEDLEAIRVLWPLAVAQVRDQLGAGARAFPTPEESKAFREYQVDGGYREDSGVDDRVAANVGALRERGVEAALLWEIWMGMPEPPDVPSDEGRALWQEYQSFAKNRALEHQIRDALRKLDVSGDGRIVRRAGKQRRHFLLAPVPKGVQPKVLEDAVPPEADDDLAGQILCGV